MQVEVAELEVWGGARGGLGGYSPPLEHASPPLESEKRFWDIFGIYGTLKTIYGTLKIPGATPGRSRLDIEIKLEANFCIYL